MSKRAIQLLSPVSYRALISTSRHESRVIPVDGSWYMPNVLRDPLKEFEESRLPESRFFDVDGIVDDKSSYPHMLPSLETFNKRICELGIKKSDKLVIYDRIGNFSAPRVAWTFQTFGHENVFLLDNFPGYTKYNYPLEHNKQAIEPTEYLSEEYDSNAVLSFEQFVEILSNKDKRDQYTILDARSYDRFTGNAPEPRSGLSSGHAIGARSLPFTKVLDENNKFIKVAHLKQIVRNVGVEPDKPTIVMCGTGVTACILKAALDSIGFNKGGIQVYDGSWTEFAQRASPDLIVKGK